jgi:pilus assembly protein Flp/PilA
MRGKRFFRQLLRDTRGATAVEYGLIVALVVIAMIAAFQGVGNETIGMWDRVVDRVDEVVGDPS